MYRGDREATVTTPDVDETSFSYDSTIWKKCLNQQSIIINTWWCENMLNVSPLCDLGDAIRLHTCLISKCYLMQCIQRHCCHRGVPLVHSSQGTLMAIVLLLYRPCPSPYPLRFGLCHCSGPNDQVLLSITVQLYAYNSLLTHRFTYNWLLTP